MIICLCIFSIISHFVKCHCHTSIAYMYSYNYIIPCYGGSVKAFRRQSVCFRVHKAFPDFQRAHMIWTFPVWAIDYCSRRQSTVSGSIHRGVSMRRVNGGSRLSCGTVSMLPCLFRYQIFRRLTAVPVLCPVHVRIPSGADRYDRHCPMGRVRRVPG